MRTQWEFFNNFEKRDTLLEAGSENCIYFD